MSSLATFWSDLKEELFPSVAHAEEPKEKEVEIDGEDSAEPEKVDDDEEESKEDGDDDEEDEDEDDDDDEDEETVDPLETLREKFTNGVCKDFKHHFDECTDRVLAAQEEPDYEEREYKEDCVEEFFHWQHCLNEHVPEALFEKLR